MSRAEIFAEVKAARSDKAWTAPDIAILDGALDRLGVPKDTPPPKPALPRGAKAGLAGIVGAAAAAGLFASVPQDEGTSLKAYRDIVGVWTICQGDTKNVAPGMVETEAGCRRRLEQQLIAHAVPVMTCTPRLAEPGRDYQRWAAVSLAYNIGTGAFCKSTASRHFQAGNWRAGCDAFLAWNKAGGRTVKGLQLRRAREREICLRGLS